MQEIATVQSTQLDDASQSSVPPFIEPRTIADLTDDEALRVLERIRSARLLGVQIYEQALKERTQITHERERSLLFTACERLKKECERAATVEAKLNELINKVRARRLAGGLSP